MAERAVPKYLLRLTELKKLLFPLGPSLLSSLDRKELLSAGGRGYGVPHAIVRALLAKAGIAFAFKTIAHINLKGGVGKTTATVTTATRAVQYGFRVCILDMDSQGSATLAFGLTPEEDDPVFCDVWQKPREMVRGSLKKIDEDLWILPSSLENGLLDASLTSPKHQKRAVAGVCETLRELDFDLVLIDCPPALGTAVVSSICAADVIVIPVGSDPFSRRGLDLTLQEIHAICETFNLKLPTIHTLFAKLDRREKMARQALQHLRQDHPDTFLPTLIRVSTAYSKALARKETIFATAESPQAREDFDRYTRRLLGLEFNAQTG